MAQDNNNLIWVDMEMTGLNPDTDRIIEVALVVTDSQLNVVAEGPVLVVHQLNEVLDGTGLIDKVKASRFNETEVEVQMIEFLKLHVPSGVSPMCGNSICQDRRFMVRTMPQLEAYFHYRNLDVSTFKELVKRWKPEIASGLTKESKHEALADIYDSINELKYYRQHFIVA